MQKMRTTDLENQNLNTNAIKKANLTKKAKENLDHGTQDVRILDKMKSKTGMLAHLLHPQQTKT